MKKKSHMLLGRYLKDNLQGFSAQRYEKAFLFGCVEPDYNIFTYFKGSSKGRVFEGHNYVNAESSILKIVERLQQSTRWMMPEYYCLGKLMHYLSDAFTSPHNEVFSVADHAIYEIKLHGCLEKGIASSSGLPRISTSGSIVEYILSMHNRYSEIANKGLSTDVQYIIDATGVVFSLLVPEEEPVQVSAAAV